MSHGIIMASLLTEPEPKTMPVARVSSTTTFPRNIPIWHANSYSPGSVGRNSTGTVAPSGRATLFLNAGSSTISLHAADSWRTKFRRTGLPRVTTITSGL
jgi:hypothetical protein